MSCPDLTVPVCLSVIQSVTLSFCPSLILTSVYVSDCMYYFVCIIYNISMSCPDLTAPPTLFAGWFQNSLQSIYLYIQNIINMLYTVCTSSLVPNFYSNLPYNRGQDFLDGQYHLKDRTYFDIERFSFPVQQTYVWSTLEEVDFVM